jgi:glycogen debranching enzyme
MIRPAHRDAASRPHNKASPAGHCGRAAAAFLASAINLPQGLSSSPPMSRNGNAPASASSQPRASFSVLPGAGLTDGDCRVPYRRALASFQLRFWNSERSCLFDLADVDYVHGQNDPAIRPNQILAVGGLPYQLLVEPYASRVVETVERYLLTPLGLRSLAPGEPSYRARFGGSVWERDSGYHQGTVWPWLIGPFVEAWLRVRGSTPEAKRAADAPFLAPLREHLEVAGLGHVSEVADAEPPHRPGGCPFQAWSLGELLRASRLVRIESENEGLRKAEEPVCAAV